MSRHPRNGVGRMFVGLAALLALVVASFGGLATVSAQEATPDGSPMATECESPGLPPGTPTPMDDMEGMDMGSPEAMDDMAMGTPEGEDMMMPEATPLPEGTEADEETTAAIIAAIENYAACYSESLATGDPSLFVALESENFWRDQGYSNVYDRVADEMDNPFSSLTLHAVDNPMTYDDGRVSGDMYITLGDHWYQGFRVFLVEEDGIWKWDAEAYLPPDPDVEQVSVKGVSLDEMTDEATGEVTYAFTFLGPAEIQEAEAIVFNVTNNGVELHEAVAVQLPEGADPMGILDGSVPFDQIEFLGGVFGIPPGVTQDLALLNLEPGTYHLLCFFPSPDGVPHAARGMIAEFTVTERPEE